MCDNARETRCMKCEHRQHCMCRSLSHGPIYVYKSNASSAENLIISFHFKQLSTMLHWSKRPTEWAIASLVCFSLSTIRCAIRWISAYTMKRVSVSNCIYRSLKATRSSLFRSFVSVTLSVYCRAPHAFIIRIRLGPQSASCVNV